MSQAPQVHVPPAIELRLAKLIRRLADGNKKDGTFGTFGTFIPVCYDTAWLAMVTKSVNGTKQLLFPKCLEYLLRNQAPGGGWGKAWYPTDAIMNSLAGMLCLVRHRESGIDIGISLSELNERISNAQNFVTSVLSNWTTEENTHWGFELAIPPLLTSLSKYAIDFDFPAKEKLHQLNAAKLGNFDPKLLYVMPTTNMTHYLEIFEGLIDFNLVKRHLLAGSMMGSPSATAAYLMNAGTWDETAEAYLQTVYSSATDEGGISCLYPSLIFEASWVLSALLSAGISVENLRDMGAGDLFDYIYTLLKAQNGIVGFDLALLPDADDTGKCLHVLSYTEYSIDPIPMISTFGASDSFRTYVIEIAPSFSTNCSVLLALCVQPDPTIYMTHIIKATSFLLKTWDDDAVSEKWNRSPIYAHMLFSQTSIGLWRAWDDGKLGTWTDDIMLQRLASVALDSINRILPEQNTNGSWAGSPEITAYAVLAIANVLQLPLTSQVRDKFSQVLHKGRSYIQANEELWDQPEYLWIGKLLYGSSFFAEVYCIAAILTPTSPSSWSERTRSFFQTPESTGLTE